MEQENKKKYKVLIVDDIPNNLNFVSDALFNEGLDITVATNGPDAIEIAQLKSPDLILLDISMPEMDGYEVCEALRKDPKTELIPVIFLTAKVESEDIIRGFEVGAVDYVVKPFNAMELLSRVRTHLELKDKREQLELMNKILEDKVTERTKELENSNKALTMANDKLSKLDRAKSEFIMHINHELRTPLQGIHGYSKLLEEIANSEQKEFVKGLNTLTDRLVSLSELSLLFTELKAENYKMIVQPIPLVAVFDKLKAKHTHNDKNIIVQTEIEPINIRIAADEKLIFTVIDILIENALKYSKKNDLIYLKASQDDKFTIIEVVDQGPGFTDKARNAVFDLLNADNLNQQSHGFGIGLATAKLIMDTISGNIEIENEFEKGARVRLVIPLS